MKLNNQYFILRHGETIYQTKKKDFIYPWPDNPPVKLTKKGEKEIKKLAHQLKKEKIDLIYSSDIFRAAQTAKIIARELKFQIGARPSGSRPLSLRAAPPHNICCGAGLGFSRVSAYRSPSVDNNNKSYGRDRDEKIIFDKRLRDVNLGIYQNKKKKEFYQAFPDSQKKFFLRPKGGESWSDAKKRVLNFIKEIDKKHKNKKILIVGHGDPLWLLEGTVKRLSQKELLKQKLEKRCIKTGELRRL